jgi:hypothetical protein
VNPIELLRAGPPIKNGAILGFLSVRNEALRLPAMLNHHRRLGVDQFVIVDNDSDDGTRDLLAAMPDVQLYSAPAAMLQLVSVTAGCIRCSTRWPIIIGR